jgi:hypothetical protein
MAASDLTTLANVKAWLPSPPSDAVLSALISACSRAIYSLIQRPSILPATYTEGLNGNGSDRVQLKNWPVISISSLVMDGIAVQQAPPLPASPVASYGYGWVLETIDPSPPGRQANLYLRGGRFSRFNVQNIIVSYLAGYQTTETQTVAGGALTALAPYGAWASDQGVTYATTGAALTKVASAPAVGQYSVSAGAYTFNAADNGAAVTLSYGFIPYDLSQACMEWVAQRAKARDNIGYRSKSLGGQETVTFDTSAAPDSVKMMLQPYRRVTIC